VARGDGKARLHSGLIGRILNRIHHCSRRSETWSFYPGSPGRAAGTSCRSLFGFDWIETGLRIPDL